MIFKSGRSKCNLNVDSHELFIFDLDKDNWNVTVYARICFNSNEDISSHPIACELNLERDYFFISYSWSTGVELCMTLYTRLSNVVFKTKVFNKN
jgi:hypothetical protein